MKLFSTLILTILFIVFSVEIEKPNNSDLPIGMNVDANLAYATGCTVCDETTEEECHRVIQGNEVHIYYGEEKDCPDEEDQLP